MADNGFFKEKKKWMIILSKDEKKKWILLLIKVDFFSRKRLFKRIRQR